VTARSDDPRARSSRAPWRLYLVTLDLDAGASPPITRLYSAQDPDGACESALAALCPPGSRVLRVRRVPGKTVR
jgi:hypothetical protein